MKRFGLPVMMEDKAGEIRYRRASQQLAKGKI